MPGTPTAPALVVGRYALYEAIASGGMATVHLGRQRGEAGFARTVAIKRMHPHLAQDAAFVAMFVEEARLAARVRHPNVVSMLDVAAEGGELFLVMDYVQGESLARLITLAGKVPPRIASALLSGVLHGLHAAHEAKGDAGEPLHIVHRDVSPQNVLVGVDGVARVLDFGIAKTSSLRRQETLEGVLRGKLSYMAPEQIERGKVDRRTDVYAAGVVLWESLVGKRLFEGHTGEQVCERVLLSFVEAPSTLVPEITPALDEIVLRALDRRADNRFATAREMALALERCVPPALPSEVGEWVEATAGDPLQKRATRVLEIESGSAPAVAHSPATPAPAVASRTPRRAAGLAAVVLLAGVAAGLALALGSRTADRTGGSAGLDTASGALADTRGIGSAPLLASSSPASSAPPTGTAEPLDASVAAPPAGPTPVRRSACNPPYTRGPDGAKIWKRECFH
jgi:hypothetical protein